MITVLGLGNPGAKYAHTRHNAGFDAVERAAAFFRKKPKKRCFRMYRQVSVSGGLLVQPLTFMNSSGKIIKYFDIQNPADLVVVCDNMDLACGGLRIRKGGGNSGQKGLASVAEVLGSNDFVRIYIGIGRPKENVSVVDHVLGRETDERLLEAYNAALDCAAKAICKYLAGASIEELQCEFNRKGIC